MGAGRLGLASERQRIMAHSIEHQTPGQEVPAGDSGSATGIASKHRSESKRWLLIGVVLALVVVGALSLYFRGRAPAGTKVDSSGQQGRGPK
jgi:hypothetical protein